MIYIKIINGKSSQISTKNSDFIFKFIYNIILHI